MLKVAIYARVSKDEGKKLILYIGRAINKEKIYIGCLFF